MYHPSPIWSSSQLVILYGIYSTTHLPSGVAATWLTYMEYTVPPVSHLVYTVPPVSHLVYHMPSHPVCNVQYWTFFWRKAPEGGIRRARMRRMVNGGARGVVTFYIYIYLYIFIPIYLFIPIYIMPMG